ncbi:MAG: VPLPA-CTERM sorting domain-containing protein [Gammaproteobacteria bacterium]|nr:VPLPA-CTERM sorting domain-containing protein [Gammaproteobacteria bacterium]
MGALFRDSKENNAMNPSLSRRALTTTFFTTAGLLLASVTAQALTLSLNASPAGFTEVSGGTVSDSRYRISNNNWDMIIAPAGNPISGFAQSNLGNDAALSGNTYAFEAKYTAGTGYSFQIFGSFNGGTLVDPLVSWTTADGAKNGKSPTDSYNAILLNARADGVSTMTISDLAFSISGASTSGSLASPMAVAGGSMQQWLVADGSLSGTSWTLTGKLNGTGAAAVGDEGLKFDVYTKNVSLVPVPAAAWLLASALGGLAGLRRLRQHA